VKKLQQALMPVMLYYLRANKKLEITMIKIYCVFILVLASFGAGAEEQTDKQAITSVLDQFHQAAANANADQYLSLLSDDAVFLGTDASERWTKIQFTKFVQPYFSQGKGWSYVSKQRNISLLPVTTVAFFDELLQHKKYGTCRGTGVLIKTKQGWKISQYNLSLPIPNDIITAVVGSVKTYELRK
jgi:ketosteroid isomerase-like protein